MNRFFSIAILGAAAVVAASAGTIVPGPNVLNLGTDKDGGGSILNKNLATAGYIPCNSASGCPSNPTINTAPPSGAAYTFSGDPGIANVPFEIASGSVNDIWAPGNATQTPSITMDVGNYTNGGLYSNGIFAVDQVWTMINDWFGVAGTPGITITFNGENAAGTQAIQEQITLTAGIDYRSIGTSLNNPTPCDVANNNTASLGTSCSGDTDPTAQSVGTDSRAALSATPGVSVTVYNSAYQSGDSAGNNYWLDVQDIVLGSAFLGGYLDTINITSNDGAAGCATTATCFSERPVLSAVTVDSAVPEPGSVFLFGTGLSGIAFWRLRRAKRT
jgi:hypothetical protein